MICVCIYRKTWTLRTWLMRLGAGTPEICRQAAGWKFCRSDVAFEPKAVWRQNSFLFWEPVFPPKALGWSHTLAGASTLLKGY